jgi:aspartyl-tRNA(Asn)/glutamyl-tRNA(Gln) amidotransferase subunit C
MAVTPEEVRRVGELARLTLDPAEVEELTAQLNGILGHMEALAAAPDGGPSPTDEADSAAPLRADEPGPDPLRFPPDQLAPAWEAGFFTVPRLASHEDADSATAEGTPGS